MGADNNPGVCRYVFADVTVDCARFRIIRGGRVEKITPRAFEVLRYLMDRPDRVVEKQELFDGVWENLSSPITL